jgi:hypothetical protein
MIKPLNYDKGFLPCVGDEGGEVFVNGIFEFNISKMLIYLESKQSPVEISTFEISDYHGEFSSINESYVDSVDLDQPVIVAEISPNNFNLIDGNHRAEKAKRNNISLLPCYRLYAHQHVVFLTDKDAYFEYVEYWNEKIRQ